MASQEKETLQNQMQEAEETKMVETETGIDDAINQIIDKEEKDSGKDAEVEETLIAEEESMEPEDFFIPEEEEEKIQEIKPQRKSYTNSLVPAELAEADRVVKAGKRRKRKLYNTGVVYTEEGVVKLNKDNSQEYKDYMDLVASAKNGNILKGKLMRREESEHGMLLAVIKYGTWDVKIPAEHLIDISMMPPLKSDQTEQQLYKTVINHRLGTMVDFRCMQVNERTRLAIGSHIEAMTKKAINNYTVRVKGQDARIERGMIVEAQIIQVNSIGIYVEAFGAEGFIKNDEIDWLRRADITEMYSPGDKVYIKLLDVLKHTITIPFIDPKTNKPKEYKTVKIVGSIKQTTPNPNEKYYDKYKEDTCGIGVVTQITESGIYTIFDEEISVKCNHYETGDGRQPQIGDNVMVRLTRKYEDTRLFMGEIYHVNRRANMI